MHELFTSSFCIYSGIKIKKASTRKKSPLFFSYLWNLIFFCCCCCQALIKKIVDKNSWISLLLGLNIPGFVWLGRFLSLLKILLQLCMLAVPQVQAAAAAHCPSELTGFPTKLDDPQKNQEHCLDFSIWIFILMFDCSLIIYSSNFFFPRWLK